MKRKFNANQRNNKFYDDQRPALRPMQNNKNKKKKISPLLTAHAFYMQTYALNQQK